MISDAPAPIPPGGVVGVCGGGQLGRMLAMAAARLGLRTHVYAPEADPPAGDVAWRVTQGGWDDPAALARFAATVDVVTFEFENVPVAAAEFLAELVPVRPSAHALGIAQDRAAEKRFAAEIGLATAPWAEVNRPADLGPALAATGLPAILKTRRLGYDGKGQARIAVADGAQAAWEALGAAPCILEGVVAFQREVAVIAARGLDGAVVCYDPVETRHEDGILRRAIVPATLPARLAQDAVLAAGRVVTALDYVGVMGVEMFAAPGGLILNEIAPRVHNSGHWTLDACAVDQFEQQIRAVCGWPLGDGSRHADAVMENLLGDEAADWPRLAAEPGLRLHLYGKGAPRPGRKMGHWTRLSPRG